MALYNIVYSSAADTYVAVAAPAYATARTAVDSTAAFATATPGIVANSFASPNYSCGQIFLVFDTSAISAGAGTGYFSVNVNSFLGNVNADTLRFRQVASVANKIAGGALSTHTPVLSDPGTFPTAAGIYKSALADVAALPRQATLNVLLHTAGEENNTTPTGLNRCHIDLSEVAGTTSDPTIFVFLGTPWEFLGVSSTVEVATTAHALVTTGIAGTLQAGDLLVACIGSRIASTTSVTLPTGGAWTLVSEQKNNNILATTSAAASGLMAYCIRGASNPNLTFTHPVAPSVALGRILAYRNVNQSSPKDTQTSATCPINTSAVSVTGLTTTQADDLIVAMCAGGQEAQFSQFNATDPAGSSGTASSITEPPVPTWQKRGPGTVTTTGVDTALATFDAVKTSVGATGNFTATAAVAPAAHVVIAGAFKIVAAAPTPVTGTGTPAAQASDTDGLGTSSSEGSGTPASQASAVSGLGTVAVPGVTGTGTPAAQSSDVDGTGVSAWIAGGALVATTATVAGAGLSSSDGTGTAAVQSSAASGVGVSVSSGSGAAAADAATVAGTGSVSSAEATGTGALAAQTAAVAGDGLSASTGTGNAVAEPAAVAGTGSAAAANSGALVADSAAVAGDGVSGADGAGALAADAAAIVGAGLSVSTGSGALACSPVTVAGVGVVLEEGATIGTGELLAGAATISGEGEVTGEVAPPIDVGGGFYPYPQPRPVPVIGYGYGILPQIKGEAHGVVGAVGRSIGTLPRFAGQADAASGAAGSSSAHLTVKAAASGNVVARGRGSGMFVKFEGAAVGRHDDDEAAIVAWLLAA